MQGILKRVMEAVLFPLPVAKWAIILRRNVHTSTTLAPGVGFRDSSAVACRS